MLFFSLPALTLPGCSCNLLLGLVINPTSSGLRQRWKYQQLFMHLPGLQHCMAQKKANNFMDGQLSSSQLFHYGTTIVVLPGGHTLLVSLINPIETWMIDTYVHTCIHTHHIHNTYTHAHIHKYTWIDT